MILKNTNRISLKNILGNKFSILSLILLSIIFFLFHSMDKGRLNFSERITNEPEKAPNDWLYMQRAFPYGLIDTRAYFKAIADKKTKFSNTGRFNAEWKFCGPTNQSGRITDIEMTQGFPQTIYVGSASGGIFRSGDDGDTWIPIFDEALSLSIGDMALAPSDNEIMYVGTGEANAGGGSIAYDGNGVYKTTDGGDNWEHLGLDNVGNIGKVVVHPHDPQTCFVAAMGPLFQNSEERGVYKTQDGGDTWDKVLFLNDSTGGIDLAIHPQNPDTIFAATWERIRRVNRRAYGGPSSGIFRSFDGGDTWQELLEGLPSTAGRIGIAISQSNPEILYAVYVHEISSLIKGIYKSTNNGNSWTEVNSADIYDQAFMYWFGKIIIDPEDPDVVYYPGFIAQKSTDGGDSWNDIFEDVHADQHAICIDPNNPERVLLGNDGGAFESTNGGNTYDQYLGIPSFQFYTTEADQSLSGRIYGGAQDNGTVRTSGFEINEWESIYGGDGFKVLVDPTDNTYVYAEYQYGNLASSNDGGFYFAPATNGISPFDRKNWNTPVVFDPADPSILYYGTNKLYKSTNRASTWQPISPDLTNNLPQNNLTYGTITSISVSHADTKIIYTGTDDGKVSLTTDGGDNWNTISSTLPKRWVTSIVTDPEDAATAYIAYSGYRFGENIGHIYKTNNLGIDWIDISGNLPDVPINDIVKPSSDNSIYVATDIGVFYTTDDGVQWNLLQNGMPQVVITDLVHHEADNLLVAATYGRGMYRIDLDDLISSTGETDYTNHGGLKVYPNPFSENTSIKVSIEHSGIYSINILDANGNFVKNISNSFLEKGDHEFEFGSVQIPAGLYLCEVRGVASHKITKLIKG